MIEIIDLHVAVSGKRILNGVNLTVLPGEIHAIMGPNGAGKSTLAKVFAGDPDYEILSGDILFNGESILDLEIEERARLGIFMGFQYPLEIPGVNNFEFLFAAKNAMLKARSLPEMNPEAFHEFLDEKLVMLKMKPHFKERNINEGFSGGEKKRNEILQMAVLEPTLSILDETDSGLDIDAMKVVAEGIHLLHSPEHALILITHYQRLLDYIRPDFVHVFIDGQIVLSGDQELALKLEENGYDWVLDGSCSCS